jgi:hypothetical protein
VSDSTAGSLICTLLQTRWANSASVTLQPDGPYVYV